MVITPLHEQLKERFPVLQILVEHENRPQTIELTWREKLIESTADLQSVARHCHINKQVVHLFVITRDRTDEDVLKEQLRLQ